MSLIGSLTLIRPLSLWSSFRATRGRIACLPTRLRHARQATDRRQLPETDPAEPKLPHVCAAAPAQMTTINLPSLELRRSGRLDDQTLLGHSGSSDSPLRRSRLVAPFGQTACRVGSAAAALLRQSWRWSRG